MYSAIKTSSNGNPKFRSSISLLLIPLLTLLVGCSSLRVKNLRVTDTQPARYGTKLTLAFTVEDSSGMGVNGLQAGPEGNFSIFEDGGHQDVTGESMTDVTAERGQTRVSIILDRSWSIANKNAYEDVKGAAMSFAEQLQNDFSGHITLNYYQFAPEVEKMASLHEYRQPSREESYTSLYSAVKQAIMDNPEDILVVLSDGADTYSHENEQNPVDSLAEIAKFVRDNNAIVHCIGLGGVKEFRDFRQQKSGNVLHKLARNGSVHMTTDPKKLKDVFLSVAKSISSGYYLEYHTPNKSGTHRLKLVVKKGGSKGRAEVNYACPVDGFNPQ